MIANDAPTGIGGGIVISGVVQSSLPRTANPVKIWSKWVTPAFPIAPAEEVPFWTPGTPFD